jgi:hypothetical protein
VPTPRGFIDVAWQHTSSSFQLDVSVPPNSRATVHMGGRQFEIGSGSYHFQA